MPPLPSLFLDMLRGEGHDLFTRLPAALDGEAPSVAIRLNRAKAGGAIPDAAYADGQVPWEPAGFYLKGRPAFTFDPLLHQGAYYVQDPSSMVTGHILRHLLPRLPRRPLAMLDACAAPGGKATAAIAALPPGSVVVANEADASRVGALSENVARWGNPWTVVTAGPAERFASMPGSFDIVAVDAPCSGEGMMRKEAVARTQWSPSLVAACAALQRRILEGIWPSLRPGGYLVYSTCTFNTLENEANLKWIVEHLGAEPVTIPCDPSWGVGGAVEGPYPAMRFVPGLVRGEGLFAAVVRKPGVISPEVPQPRRQRRRKESPYDGLLSSPDDFEPRLRRDGVTLDLLPASPLLPPPVAAECRPAVTLGAVKGRALVPDTSLALSSALRQGAYPEAEVDASGAIAYLRHEALTLPGDTERGIVLLRHAGLPLGFVKNLGNRANNLHRQQWRIISSGEPRCLLAF